MKLSLVLVIALCLLTVPSIEAKKHKNKQLGAISGTWTNIPGGLKVISVDDDGSVWGINSGDAIYYSAKGDGSDWKNVAGALSWISVRNGYVWGVNSAGNIYTRIGFGGSWR